MKMFPTRRAIAVAAAAAALALPASASAATPVLSMNFDEGAGTTVNDASGNANHGTIRGATWTSGLHGGGLDFDGVDDLVEVADAPELRPGTEMTLSGWVKQRQNQTTGYQPVISKADLWVLYAVDPYRGGPSGIFNGEQWIADDPIARDTWVHVAATFSPAGSVTYVNGQPVSTSHWTLEGGAFGPADAQVEVGASSWWGDYLNGVLDDVRVYAVALTQAEIQTDMSTPVA